MSDAIKRLQARQSGSSPPKYNPLDALIPNLATNSDEDIVFLPMNKLHDFAGHTFRMRPGHEPYIQSLTESIKENGILQPLIVRPHPSLMGDYEIVAGHTRKYIGINSGLTSAPCIIKNLDDDDAIIQMGETNVQRPDWLPSEKAKTYKVHLEALQHKYSNRLGRPRNNTSEKWEPSSHFSDGSNRIRDLAAQRWGLTGRAFDTYIKLNDLDDGLMSMIDAGQIPVKAGYQLSFLPLVSQQQLLDLLRDFPKCTISESKARDIRTFANERDVWPRILGIDGSSSTAKTPIWEFKIPRNTLSSLAKKYLGDPELQSLIAETINRYISQREANP